MAATIKMSGGYFQQDNTPTLHEGTSRTGQRYVSMTVPVVDEDFRNDLRSSGLASIADGFDGREEVYAFVPFRRIDERGHEFTRADRVQLLYAGSKQTSDGRTVDLFGGGVAYFVVEPPRPGDMDLAAVRANGIRFEKRINIDQDPQPDVTVDLGTWQLSPGSP